MTSRPIILPAGWRLHAHETLDSTNAEAQRLAAGGSAHGTVVWALRQSAGKGRQGRSWESPEGNLYFSVILRPATSPSKAAQLGFVASLSVAEALDNLAPQIDYGLKWPNDVLFNSRKGCGILLESTAGEDGSVRSLVVGIGINLTTAPGTARYPATSLRREGIANKIGCEVLLEAVCQAFAKEIEIWHTRGFGPIREAWLARAVALGERIEARLPCETLAGIFEDLDGEGCLLLRQEDGRIRRISAGDVYLIDEETIDAPGHRLR